MKRMLSADDLARDSRFARISVEEAIFDPRTLSTEAERRRVGGFRPEFADGPDRARALMHGIFVGEIQALEGAGRTCFDYDVARAGVDDADAVPFELKLDMARQCWDEARHCEISIKLGDHMGTEIGEFSEQTSLFEAACNADPILRDVRVRQWILFSAEWSNRGASRPMAVGSTKGRSEQSWRQYRIRLRPDFSGRQHVDQSPRSVDR